MVASSQNFPLLSELLAEQQRLDTPAARFSAAHAAGPAARSSASSSQLIPLSAPGPGEQYAFEVDLDSCTGCKSCVAACHALNGLDDEETWRDVGLLLSEDRRHPFQQTVTTACHHCADPACLNGCPVLAYEKDAATGIVRHLDDQCIGCSYCVLKCPYDVPKYSPRLGIVRKCDMCHGRLAHGEPPACAQACPTQAIRIVTVGVRTVTNAGPAGPPPSRDQAAPFLPGAPDPSHTRPTTRYITRRRFPAGVTAADSATLRPQPAHWPLVILLTLMPLAVGCNAFAAFAAVTREELGSRGGPWHQTLLLGWLAGIVGTASSLAHLGRPLRAWRIFLGLGRSWLSREAVLFGAWLGLYSVLAAMEFSGWPGPAGGNRSYPGLAVGTAVLGVAGLFCSVMIYADTRRRFWRVTRTAPRFFGSAVVLGLAAAAACGEGLVVDATGRPLLALVLATAVLAKLAFESQALAPLRDNHAPPPDVKTARLLIGPLRPAGALRIGCALCGGVLAPLLLAVADAPAWLAWLALVLLLAGELLERSLFFRAVDAPKMPGLPS